MIDTSDLAAQLKWDPDSGLIPAIVQDDRSGEVLMLAWMDRAAFDATCQTRRAHFYSRSRQRMWMKGESSGHVQQVKAILTDCDADTLLLKVEQVGGIACHTGRASCFHLQGGSEGWFNISPVLKDPAEIYAPINSEEE
jgi:phosphoribosyl-AMP cyclohydrolase